MEIIAGKTYVVAYLHVPENCVGRMLLRGGAGTIKKEYCQFEFRISTSDWEVDRLVVKHDHTDNSFFDGLPLYTEKIKRARFGQLIKCFDSHYIIICEDEKFLDRAIAKTSQLKTLIERQNRIIEITIDKTKKEMSKFGELKRILNCKK